MPFFSISPRGKRFTVPQIICEESFSFQALFAYGHVESNPNFPVPDLLVPNPVKVQKKYKTVFARRFDKSSQKQLTYILFGKEKHFYLVHYLTDDENSFDQILSLKVNQENTSKFKEILNQNQNLVVTLDLSRNLSFRKNNEFKVFKQRV